jgi:hypothetical protein
MTMIYRFGADISFMPHVLIIHRQCHIYLRALNARRFSSNICVHFMHADFEGQKYICVHLMHAD